MTKEIPQLLERIQDYFAKGGLFNPELMEHDKVNVLMMDIRSALQRAQAELVQAKAEAENAKEERNRCTALERAKYLPKLTEVTRELARLKEQVRRSRSDALKYAAELVHSMSRGTGSEDRAVAIDEARDLLIEESTVPLPEPPKGEGK